MRRNALLFVGVVVFFNVVILHQVYRFWSDMHGPTSLSYEDFVRISRVHRNVSIALPEQTRAPNIVKTVRYKTVGAFGRQCNRLVILSTGLELAKREGFVLVIDKGDFPILQKLDMYLFKQHFAGLFVFQSKEHKYEPVVGHLVGAHSYWCGLKVNLLEITRGFRPSPELRRLGEKELEKIKRIDGNDTIVVSVHLRHYDGLCERLLPNVCEWKSDYEFEPYPFGCNQTLTSEFWKWIKNDWPEYPWANKKVSIYLSTDRQVESIDRSYLDNHKSFGIQNVYLPSKVKSDMVRNEYHPVSEMFVDMWVSVLADFYVGMPRSSCDKIVAEWRGQLRNSLGESTDTVHPRKCFAPYFFSNKVPTVNNGMCPHTRYLALDSSSLASPYDSLCAVCELIIALAMAISKAKKHNMGLHVYGIWGQYIKSNFDIERLSKDVDIFFVEGQEHLLYDRIQIYDSGKFRGSAIRASNQVRCAQGHTLNSLSSLTIIPKLEIRKQVADRITKQGIHTRMASSNEKACNLNSYCSNRSGSDESCEETFLESMKFEAIEYNGSFVHDLWEKANVGTYRFFDKSPCSQVVAIWRAANGMLGDSGCCFRGYQLEKDKEPTNLSDTKDIYWKCA